MSRATALEYPGDELAAMAEARNYYEWILERWRPHLGGTVLELGAGIGTFSSRLARERLDRLILVEPVPQFAAHLRLRFAGERHVDVREGLLEDCLPALAGRVDGIVAVNVMEHIADDRQTFRTCARLLRPGGRLLVYVPALRWLWGPMDEHFGHVRRYGKKDLEKVLAGAGFESLDVRFTNLLGGVSWFIANRVLRRRTLTPRMVRLSDRTVIPLTAWLERVVRPPLGQSLVAVAAKT
jgi:SAM-dependent methyltransferase